MSRPETVTVSVGSLLISIIVGFDEQWLDITAGYKLPHRWTKRVPLRSGRADQEELTSSGEFPQLP